MYPLPQGYFKNVSIPALQQPYYCGQNVLLAHSQAYHLGKSMMPNSTITFKNNGGYKIPLTNSSADAEAVQRAWDFNEGVSALSYSAYSVMCFPSIHHTNKTTVVRRSYLPDRRLPRQSQSLCVDLPPSFDLFRERLHPRHSRLLRPRRLHIPILHGSRRRHRFLRRKRFEPPLSRLRQHNLHLSRLFRKLAHRPRSRPFVSMVAQSD